MFKYSLLRLSQKHINTQVNHSDTWQHVNNTNEPIIGQLVNNTGQSPPCRKITKVSCQVYGYRKMEACPSDRASVIKEFTNGSIYFKMQENIVEEFKGKLARFTLHCLLEHNTSSQLSYKFYHFLLKFNGFPAIGSTKEEVTKKTRNIYWWILGILSVILVLLLASLTGLYIKRKREDEEDWVEMKRILETSITPTIYAEISNTKAIYQRIPDDPIPLSSPFPKTGPLAYANFLNLDENNGNDTFPIHSPRKRAFHE